MPLRSLGLILLLAFTPAFADENDAAAHADAEAAKIENVADYLRGMRDAIELAKKGEYGKIDRKQRKTLDDSYERLRDLLDGHDSPLELPLAERIDVINAQERIVAILDRHPKDTMICRKKKTTGTRIPGTECLTIAQREARARNAREAMDRLAKPNPCVSGQNC